MNEMLLTLIIISVSYAWTEAFRINKKVPIGSNLFRLILAIFIVLWTSYSCFVLASESLSLSAFEAMFQTIVMLVALICALIVALLLYKIEYDVYVGLQFRRRTNKEVLSENDNK